mmetsp:Transcript_724/g.2255  ORF Transcript_724/g.2255 Transcript_724/m.2255 type:complete len:171 (-) Transcript_724:21-533(-)
MLADSFGKLAEGMRSGNEQTRVTAATRLEAAMRGRKARSEQKQRKEAAIKVQAVNRGRRARKALEMGDGGVSSGDAVVDDALSSLWARCDAMELGVSASELEEKVSADMHLRALLAPGGSQQILHQFELGRWLETEGRVSYNALVQIVRPALPGAAGRADSVRPAGEVTC